MLLESPTPRPVAASRCGRRWSPRAATSHYALRTSPRCARRPRCAAGDAVIMGRPGVMLSLASQYGANTLTTTLALEKALASLAPALKAQGITVYPALHRPANFIERALQDLEHSLIVSAVLILVVLFLFLSDLRAALIAFLAIPSVAAGRGGGAQSHGADHQHHDPRRIRGGARRAGGRCHHRHREHPAPAPRECEAARAARAWMCIREPRSRCGGRCVYATIVVIIVFLPELFSTSLAGKFLGPLALAFILAVLPRCSWPDRDDRALGVVDEAAGYTRPMPTAGSHG